MKFIELMIRQPVTVAVGVVLIIMAGLVAFQRLPIQLTPNVDDTIIAVSTMWEGASPEEVEQSIIEKQEEKLQGLANLRAMTSESQQGFGRIRLEFIVGTNKDDALREVSDKLREVPDYPEHADEPIVEASDPDSQDYIAWVVFGTTDPDFDVRTLQDFAEDRIKPVLERVEGVSEVNVLGGREREAQIRFDPLRLARYGVTLRQLVNAIQGANLNVSGGELPDAKFNVRLRTVSQYESIRDVEQTIIAHTPGGPVYLRDLATVVEGFKEPGSFVRSRGRPVIAVNAQREVGSNVMKVMEGLRGAIVELNEPGGILDAKSTLLGLDGKLYFTQAYDQTTYIDDALGLVLNNIWFGGGLAVLVLLLFLRSFSSVGIIALAIPISVVGAIVTMVALGRSVNVISLAGMAFAIGMVVDNSIVVLENIFRHLELGKSPRQAALDGAREVWAAVLASTLTTIVVFIPILLVQDEAGQLFRDIALAICAAVGLSLLVSITVIPSAGARLLKPLARPKSNQSAHASSRLSDFISKVIYRLCGSVLIRIGVVGVLTAASLVGSYALMPPVDYLPAGNRNIVFGLLIPPPGHNLHQLETLAQRIESTVEPYWEAGRHDPDSPDSRNAIASLPEVPTFNWMLQAPGDPVVPPPLDNYFVVGMGSVMFHGGISQDPTRAVDMIPLFQHATRAENAPGVLAFAFQLPLFQLGGSTGSAVKIDFSGDSLDQVSAAATAMMLDLMGQYGNQTVQPSPSNFSIYGPELRITPKLRRLSELDMTPADLGLTAQAHGDGTMVGEYRVGGESIDLKLIANNAVDRTLIGNLDEFPVATPEGFVVPFNTLGTFQRFNSPAQINHVNRRRSITLLFTPPPGMPLQEAVDTIAISIDAHREAGSISPQVATGLAGSASKLESVRKAMLGDGTLIGTLNSSLVMALLVVYLLMCVLFQSFWYPLVIMFSVPLATLGGFAALFGVFLWSVSDRYIPMQSLDVLTMLGFIILIGVVVNNAILIIHQALHFMHDQSDMPEHLTDRHEPRRAIAEAVRTRIRPIFMSTLTSVGAMFPLVLMPGSGSELYRGLGSVVIGGLLVSTIFTILLVPLLFSLVLDLRSLLTRPSSLSTVPG